jgi:electron transfer flavoprotein beta subunit
MELLVFIKQVPDDQADIRLDPASGTPKLDGVESVVNAFDSYALEMAARFVEAHGGQVTVATIGDKSAEGSVKNCLAVGADKGFLINDDMFKDSDPTAKAYILGKAVAKLEEINQTKYDIIFTGREATDYAKGQVGIILGEELGIAAVTDVVGIDPSADGVEIRQVTDSGYNRISASTPCVVAVTKPDYDPRYPTIKSKMKARKANVPAISAGDIGAEADKAGASGSMTKVIAMNEPSKRQAGVKIQEESAGDSVAKAVAIIAEAKVL